jgi:hypothetical protein
MNFNLVERPRNRKVGKALIVQAPRDTCWDGCPFKKVCYGEAWPLSSHWNKVEEQGAPLAEVRDRLLELQPERWRYGDVGDLPGKSGRINKRQLKLLVEANADRRWGWAYTHKPMTEENQRLVRWANSQGFCINLSSEGWRRADELAELEVGPVFTVLPHTLIDSRWKRSETPEGRLIVRCPAERIEGFTCATCGGGKGPLCARADRGFIIGVTTHGTYKNKVANIVAEIEMFGQPRLP